MKKIVFFLLLIFLVLSCSSSKKTLNKKKSKEIIISKSFEKMANYCNQGKVFVCKKLAKNIEILIKKKKGYIRLNITDTNDPLKLWEIGFLLKYRKISNANSYYYFKKACDLGNMKACNELGIMYISSYGYTSNLANRKDFFNSCTSSYKNCMAKMATLYFSKACDKNESTSCAYLGYIKKYEDIKVAKIYLKKSCDLGSYFGCLLYSSISYPSIKKDIISLLYRACVLGSPHACYNIVEMTKKKIISYNKEKINKSMEVIRNACDIDDASSCTKLANIYSNFPEIIKKDIKKAKTYYEKSCLMDDLLGCNHLGYIYDNIEKNFSMAENYYYKACSMNFAKGCVNLGFLYYQKLYVDLIDRAHLKACKLDLNFCKTLAYHHIMGNNEKFAIKLYNEACSRKDGASCLAMAYFYKKNKKEYKNILNQGLELLSDSCERKNVNSCVLLAKEYEKGFVVKKSKTLSKIYHLKACKLGNFNSCKIINSNY